MVSDKIRLQQQKTYSELIVNFTAGTQAEKTTRAFTVADYDARVELLERYYEYFFDNHIALDENPERHVEQPYYVDKVFDSVMQAYLTSKAWHREQATLLQAPQVKTGVAPAQGRTAAPNYNMHNSLEQVRLKPPFTGNSRDWQAYRDKFIALVLNDDTALPIIKFQRLLNSLDGEPLELLREITVEGANFQSAWDTICKRYDDKLLRFNAQMDALVSLPAATKESATHLSALINTANTSRNIFRSLGLRIDDWDAIFIYHIENKLAPATRLDWAKEREEEADPFARYNELIEFLNRRMKTLERVQKSSGSSSVVTTTAAASGDQSRSKQKQNQSKKVKDSSTGRAGSTTAHLSVPGERVNRPPPECTLCSEKHYLMRCPKFSEMSVIDRRNFVARQRFCLNCLAPGHAVDKCTSPYRCIVCQGKHHSKLHLDRGDGNHNNSGHSASQPPSTGVGAHKQATGNQQQQLSQTSSYTTIGGNAKILTTAIVLIESPSGAIYEARALIDSCSEESYLTEHVAQALQLPRRPTYVAVSSVGGQPTSVSRSWTDFILKSKSDQSFSQQVSALTLGKLTTLLPRSTVEIDNWDYLKDLTLADPHCGVPGQIDCLLGVTVFAGILRDGLVSGPSGCPSALSTVFGWILMGGTGSTPNCQVSSTNNFHISVDHKLSQALTRFWEIEEPHQQTKLSPKDQECLDKFSQTVRRDNSGRFIVRLPFSEAPLLPGSLEIAISSLRRMEKRFRKQPALRDAYVKFMNEYHQLQHMEVVPETEVGRSEAYHIPHHPVVKEGNYNKIRVVFNASATADNGRSLNETLHSGPNLLLDVRTLLVNWRLHRFVFTCDIVKMFRQFLVDPQDRDWQRVVWRQSEDEPIQVFRLNTVTYGTVSAPFLSNACLLELADQEQDTYPSGAESIRKHRYADDFFVGAETTAELHQKADQLVNILNSAKMTVGKWASNQPSLLPELKQNSQSVDLEKTYDSVSTLGLLWNPEGDYFHYKCPIKKPSIKPTKRSILSQIARLFDPLGYLAPFIIRAKMILQALWLSGVDWDAAIPPTIEQAWQNFQSDLDDVENIRIPRWIPVFGSAPWELHGFCDASERAYAAGIYAVCRTGTLQFSSLLYAKSRVSPVKVLNVPRLELCAAELLAQIINFLRLELDSQPTATICWSDSEIVLAWLKGHPSRWKTFTANRVSEILTLLPHARWMHVPSRDNPADCATRGLSATELSDFKLWWHGPDWLLSDEGQWPAQKSEGFETSLEAKKEAFCFAVDPQDSEFWTTWLERYSSIHQIIGILAQISRFVRNTKSVVPARRLSALSAQEIGRGRTLLWRLVQRSSFPEDFRKLAGQQNVGQSSPLRRLNPFIDPDGILRVGGRLQSAALTEAERHPIILPAKHHITTLLIRDVHKQTLHGGPLVVQSVLFRQYWILHGRNCIRGEVRRCVRCARHNARSIQQQMGPLPALRTRPSRPFTCTGVDYAGPFSLKASPGRGRATFKGYVSIFVCMVTKATHVEVVSDYTTAAFLAAFKRFVGRRGLCKIMCSDNGPNLKGGDTELKKLFAETSAFSQEIAAAIAADGVEWRYNPPTGSNFGGLWEATVKAFKKHMKRVVGDALLTFEELSTLAAQIEACLNSRPISLLTSNEEDVVALTPGHFLIGAALVSPPEPFQDFNDGRTARDRWHLVTQMRNHFWARWSQEYLVHLQQRMKWLFPERNLSVGEIVLIKSELTPPTKWLMARVVETRLGPDGLCRSVVVQSADKQYERPVNKLVPLPVETQDIDARDAKK